MGNNKSNLLLNIESVNINDENIDENLLIYYYLKNKQGNIEKYFLNDKIEYIIEKIINCIQSIYDKIDLSNCDNLRILEIISEYLIIKSENLLDKNNNNIKKILDINNDFTIMKLPISEILQNQDKLSGNSGYFSYKRNYEFIEDLINLGRYSDALFYFNNKHLYGKCNFHCNCSKILYKIKKWNDIIKFYNKIDNELIQTESFINFVDLIKKNKLLSDEQLLKLSKLIVDPINKEIFVKNIYGNNLTPAYKFGSNYNSLRRFD